MKNLKNDRPQSVIVTGVSGAGKTENIKHLLDFLCEPSKEISESIKNANFILETFGNAKTLGNDNSSRFMKLVQVRRLILKTVHLKYVRLTNFMA